LAGLRVRFANGAPGSGVFSVLIVLCSSHFFLDRVAVITSITQNLQPESLVIKPVPRGFRVAGRTELAGCHLFYPAK
jgi:hypothetical protein